MIDFFQTFEWSNTVHINVCSELFYPLEKILSECKADELILPASYLVGLGATTNLDERFTERFVRSAERYRETRGFNEKEKETGAILIIVCITSFS